jgi:putative endonuclease
MHDGYREGSKKPDRNIRLFCLLFLKIMFEVYILFSQKLEKYYIGFTSNLEERFTFHLNDHQSRKYTYKADDWRIVFTIPCSSKNQAMLVEKHIKSMKSKTYIENLMKYPAISEKLKQKYERASDY